MFAWGAVGAASANVGVEASWRDFGAGSWPPAGWRPYSSSSPFNQLVGRSATHSASASLVANALQWGAPGSFTAGGGHSSDHYGHPVYFARSTDPVYVLRAEDDWSSRSIAGRRIRVPA